MTEEAAMYQVNGENHAVPITDSNKTIILAIVLLPILFNGCQSDPKTLEIPINTKLYNLPEEEGGKVIHVTDRKTLCHREETKVLKLFRYHKLNCNGLSGWITDGDQK